MVYSNERISRAVVVALRITNKGINWTVRVSLRMEFLNPMDKNTHKRRIASSLYVKNSQFYCLLGNFSALHVCEIILRITSGLTNSCNNENISVIIASFDLILHVDFGCWDECSLVGLFRCIATWMNKFQTIWWTHHGSY